MEIPAQIMLLTAGFIMLIKGADWFVEGASGIAERLGIPHLIIGLTIVAMGTSAPEAAVSITSALKGTSDMAIGNVVGSNILNILIISGITSIISEIAVKRSTIKYEIPFIIFITLSLCCLGITGREISFNEGIILWFLFILYIIYLLHMSTIRICDAGAYETAGENDTVSAVMLKWIILLITGGAAIIWGSDIAVDSATFLARTFGVSERFTGLTVVSMGTSLPELATSVSAALKGKNDIAIGNIVGSNIFNVLFITGTTALITPVAFKPDSICDTIISAAAALLLLIAVAHTRSLKRIWGIMMISAYGAYFVYIL